MNIDKNDIESNLIKKGFSIEETTHHKRFYLKYKGKEVGIRTRTSRGSKYKTYNDSLLSQMKKQLKLDTNRELKDLLTCPMSEEDYIIILKDKRLIPDD